MSNIKLVNRYKQLLAAIPKGSFYDCDGQIVPFRSSPYSLRISTNFPNRELGLFVNNQYNGQLTTDAFGLAAFSVTLQKGRNDISLIDSITQQATNVYLTTRDYATWMASEAQVIESIDTGVEQVLLDARLATVSIGLIEQVFGQTVSTGNSFGYDLDTYRELLQEIRTAYRYFGASIDGMSRVVRAFTQISPLIYPRNLGPQWLLGSDEISSGQDVSKRAYYTNSALTNVNVGGAQVSIPSFASSVGIGTGTLKCYGTISPKTLSWTAPNGAEGPHVQITEDGPYTLYSSDYFDSVIGTPGSFVIVATVNDKLKLEFDDKGPLTVTLTAGTRTATQISTNINAAFNADIRYGVSYNSVAASYDPFASGTPMVALTTPNGSNNGSIIVHLSPGGDAAQTIFNLPTIRGGFASSASTSLILNAGTDMTLWPTTATATTPFDIIVGTSIFNPVGSPGTFTAIATAEIAHVTNVNVGTKTLTLSAPLAYVHNAGELVYMAGLDKYRRATVHNSRSMMVNVGHFSLLPGSNTTDSVVVSGSAAPNDWIVTSNAGAPVSPTAAALHTYFDTDRDVPFDLNANGMVSIPIPNDILNYRGFPINISIWGRIDDPSRASTQTSVNRFDLSFDNQTTYSPFTPTIVGPSVNATWEPSEYLVQTVVPVTATRMWLRVKLSATGNGNFTIHRVRVLIPAHEGIATGAGTIPRSEQKIKQGAFLYVWCKDQLSTEESSSIGVAREDSVIPGHLDKIAPAQAWLDKFDASIDVSGEAINVVGAFTDADFLAGTMINLDLTLRTPARFSHLDPTHISTQTDTLVLPSMGPFIAPLSLTSDQIVANGTLFEDGIPITKDQWSFPDATHVHLLFTPSTTSTYTFTYGVLIQFTSQVMDLGASFADYLWFADYHAFLRPEIVPQFVNISTGIQFDTNGNATLNERSNLDQTTATLTENTGLNSRIILPSQWKFVNNQSIQIDLSIFNQSSLYELTYTAEVNHPSTLAQASVEIRSATSSAGVLTATYSSIVQNQPIDNTNRYHQMRITISNIRDTRDARIQSVLLKGLDMFGVGATVPILRP